MILSLDASGGEPRGRRVPAPLGSARDVAFLVSAMIAFLPCD